MSRVRPYVTINLGNLVLGDFVPNLLTDATRRLITYPKTFTLNGYYNNVTSTCILMLNNGMPPRVAGNRLSSLYREACYIASNMLGHVA